MTAAVREFRAPAASATTLWLSAALALGIHACVLFAWRIAPKEPPLLEVEGDSVEVALVESAPSAPAPEAAPEPPKPEPPPPVPEPPPPTPEPIPPPKPPEMVRPEPPKATPAPKPAPKPAATPKPAPKPAPPVSRPSPRASPNTTTPGTGGTATAGTGGGATGTGRPTGRPAYLVRPAAAYPAESRTAGEQGVVVLRITVNAQGRPTAVSVSRSSGFPRLDRAAVEGGWRCRVSNAVAGAQFDAPVRFSLHD